MAEDKLKKSNARNAQPPSTNGDGGESAYGSPKVSTSNDVAFEKAPRLGATQGVLSDQPRTHGNNYPGRAYPPVQAVVTECKVQEGAAKKCINTQTDSNRQELNSFVAKEGY